MNNRFRIEGLDCANCARELEEEIVKIDGVVSAIVDFMAQKVIVDCDGETLKKVKDLCNRFEEVKVVEEGHNVSCAAPTADCECAEGKSPSECCDDTGASSRLFGEKIKITGLCCANCARELEEDLNQIEGVKASVDFVNQRVVLDAESPEARDKAVYAITHFEDVKIVKEGARVGVVKAHCKEIVCLIVAVVFFIPAFALDLSGLMETDLACGALAYVFYAVAYLAVGWRVLVNTAKNIAKGRIFDENFLMTVASLGAILLGIFAGDGFAEGVAVMLLYQIGELLQAIAVGSSRDSITALMDLKSQTATLLDGEVQRVISPDELRAGDLILIKAGEKVPVDCRVVKGESALDMKSLNGEPLPRDIGVGDEILSGSINLSGAVEAEVVREYKNSAVAKILELVENSTAKKSKSEKFITKFAKYYTPAVCLAAAIVAGLVPTVICGVRGAFLWETYRAWIYTALNFLVISCPCALVISVPLTYFCGIGRCARSGILVKGSTCLDEFALSTVAAFDKTGTVTEGRFRITEYTDARTLALAAAAEKYSSHPIAAAFASVPTDVVAENAEELAGRGVVCAAEGKTLLCGNAKLLEERGVSFAPASSVSTLIYVALDGQFVGTIAIDDGVKEGAAEAISALKASGVTYTHMLTGDSSERAQEIAKRAGIDGCSAGLLPDEKLKAAEKLKERGKLLYVGDGINDAPVMTAADCAVSMGKVGSDAAIEASDIVLVSDNLSLLPLGRKIARGTRRIVGQNIVGSLAVKVAIMAMSVAIAGFPLIVSIVADVGVMLVAVLNAMRASLIA